MDALKVASDFESGMSKVAALPMPDSYEVEMAAVEGSFTLKEF